MQVLQKQDAYSKYAWKMVYKSEIRASIVPKTSSTSTRFEFNQVSINKIDSKGYNESWEMKIEFI